VNRSLCAALAIVGALSAPAGAAVLCVNPAVPSCQATIQGAVTAAVAGDTITIAAGTYPENVNIPAGKDGLKISGAGALTIVDPDLPLAGSAFTIGSANVSLKSLTIRNGNQYGVLVAANNATISGLKIMGLRNASAAGIAVSGPFAVQVLSNDIRGVGGFGIYLAGGNDNSSVKSNTVSGCGQYGIAAVGANIQIVANRVQLATSGIVVIGATPNMIGNTVEQATNGLQTSGPNPVIQGNRLTSGQVAISAVCSPCTGGSISTNSGAGFLNGVVALTDAAGFAVKSNRMTDILLSPIQLSGTSVLATLNTVSGGNASPGQACVVATGAGHTVSRNVVTRCGGAGFRSNGDNIVFDFNVSNYSNTHGFLVDGNAGANANVSVTNNRALYTNAQGFSINNGAVGTILTGNAGLKNRLDACNTTGTGFGSGNTFAATSTTCDILQ
jgi:hypothetical protein